MKPISGLWPPEKEDNTFVLFQFFLRMLFIYLRWREQVSWGEEEEGQRKEEKQTPH